jgi:branched-chain amino acid transport system ATP-binding protein
VSALLQLSDLRRQFGGVHAVDGVSVDIEDGTIFGLIGPNGAGKTTLVNLVTGYIPTQGGSIRLGSNGSAIELARRPPHVIASLGIARTFQTLRLYRNLSTIDNVLVGMHPRVKDDTLKQLFPIQMLLRNDDARIDEARGFLQQVGLNPDVHGPRRASTLSYGDQRRLEVARALALKPRLLILDEPAAGMNPAEKDRVRELIQQLNADGLTVLLIDHDMRLVMGVCRRIAVLNFGRKIAEGTPQEVSANDLVVAAYLGSQAKKTGVHVPGAEVGSGDSLNLSKTPSPGLPGGGQGGGPALAEIPSPARGEDGATDSLPRRAGEGQGGGPDLAGIPARGLPGGGIGGAPSLLEVRDLQVAYGAIQAVRGVSFGIGKGEIVALIGANGAGKSTILNTLSGVLRPKAGVARFEGLDLTTAAPETIVRRGLVQIPEGREILARLTVRENLELGAWVRRDRGAVHREIDDLMEQFPILRQRQHLAAGQLSGGEQQILAIARGLLAKPRLLLLDEPSLGLAPQMVDTVFDIIQRIHGEGVTILLVEQNALRALEIADRAYVVETGRILLSGTGQALLKNPDVQKAYLGG